MKKALTKRRLNFSSSAQSKDISLETKEQQKPLYLVMQSVWFNKIENGSKTEEYRDGSQFYKSRFCNIDKKTGEIISFKNYKSAILQEGYHAGARRMIIEVKKIELKRDFTIHLGQILERQNF
ncbi:hypothetical protein [Chryseobacterium sp. FH1]|uniref:hypothetical protein n=1 Tax=Chryseobacterium sp. FH1 TaxID=1233951 RepID=UPI0004E2CF44|nr:hypothetical protein [Chryseobacterium sp. FH1]KFC22940.1 hypothetical protein IO90_05115 [Chryseobacterium sp. FH1]